MKHGQCAMEQENINNKGLNFKNKQLLVMLNLSL